MLKNTNPMEIGHFINGKYVKGTSGEVFENRSPVDGSLISLVHEARQDEVDQAVMAARRALKGPWGKMSMAERSAILYKVAEGIEARFDEFLRAECADTGKPWNMASHIDIPRGAANFKIFADLIKNVPDEVFDMPTPDGAGALNYAARGPKGVIAVISPWNLPLLLMTWKVGPALACGNTVVVKPSEETPTTTALLGEVMNAAGVPEGVYNVVQGFGPESAGAYLTSHPEVDAITFTGETRTGEIIMQSAAIGLRNISMECGGKNPALIFADADVDKAVAGTVRSAFVNCGQVCLGTERVYVQRPLYEEFIAKLADQARQLVIGPPDGKGVSMGPLISLEHRNKVLSYYEKAVAQGADVVLGGGIHSAVEKFPGGAWIEPTIWTGVKDTDAVMKEEIFGPCCSVVPFDDEDEAVQRGNDSEYGLCAAVWTENLSRAHRVAAQMDVGLVWVNSWFLRDLRTAFGGAKQSGIGREGGVHGLEFYTEHKNICIKL
ncbi:2-hydroxymuconic semialdehyde dehydrogenase [Hyphomonas sp. BRH_c22]|uniref:2-hydroxymuconic semialdehyde dehydrogenase n=1 Tax=Hyphomonas sp. BRH_c22 TaxID=1629710 RepID=UPI00260DA3E7|nr:2-hydroxymuconic semialdehyde dehydrogenase [Hyphomonas sp. BRH_c22]